MPHVSEWWICLSAQFTRNLYNFMFVFLKCIERKARERKLAERNDKMETKNKGENAQLMSMLNWCLSFSFIFSFHQLQLMEDKQTKQRKIVCRFTFENVQIDLCRLLQFKAIDHKKGKFNWISSINEFSGSEKSNATYADEIDTRRTHT